MDEYLQLIFFALIGGVVSLIGGALLLYYNKTTIFINEYATPFAAGALLATVFLDLLKDGLMEANAQRVLLATLIGMIVFFYAERFLHWFHHHHQHEGENVSQNLVVIGDTIHNAMDGISIGAAFLLSPASGIITAIAVAAHEIPQEIGDFGLLLNKGMPKKKVLIVNILSSLATVIFAVIIYTLGSADVLPLGEVLGISAGFLLYIAASDIIPSIHEKSPKSRLFDWRPFMLIVGVLVVGISTQIAHKYIDAHSELPVHSHPESEQLHNDEHGH